MIKKIGQIYKHHETVEWVMKILEETDQKRCMRGINLYLNEGLTKFSIENIDANRKSFYAYVEGSYQNYYTINGELLSKNTTYPIVNPWKLNCNCPDDFDICKHIICTILHVAYIFDEEVLYQYTTDESVHKSISNNVDEFVSLTKELDRLEELAKASPHSLVRLGDALFWEFKPRLDKIMLDVQNIVVSSITKEDKR